MKKHKIIAALLLALFVCCVVFASWLGTCIIVKLIFMCFGWTFTLPIGTGIWLVLFVIKSIFGSSNNKSK